jgi:DNA-directed RNA polymerase subunit RPC12/RpoP
MTHTVQHRCYKCKRSFDLHYTPDGLEWLLGVNEDGSLKDEAYRISECPDCKATRLVRELPPTREMYDLVMDWPFGLIPESRNRLRAVSNDLYLYLMRADNLATWYRVSVAMAEHVDPTVVTESAGCAQVELDDLIK